MTDHRHHLTVVHPAIVNGKRIGFVATCDCGWKGSVRSWSAATDDADEHVRQSS